MVSEEEKVRLHDERLAIFHFGRFVERSIKEDKETEDMDLIFRNPKESPDAIFYLKTKNGEEYRLNVEFEGWSSNFKRHKHEHDAIKSDLIVCMLHDWADSTVPVLDVITGKVFKRHEGIKESFYDILEKLKKEAREKSKPSE